ncbi:MAG: LysR family transcriptional regulator [Deltaproteobacteria bacterium]|nr:MAG: LysR family transcriptional regulator [Deltaproteobacteria bacterium]
MMDLNALKLFIVSAQTGSFSEASRRTGVPLPTLSRRVRKLEDELGVGLLLERSPQGLNLTLAGTQLLAEAGPALESLIQAEQRLHEASGIAGTIRISIPPYFEPIWPLFSEFQRRYPAVHFDVFVTNRRINLVTDGIDITIRVGEGGFRSYVGRTLKRYRHQVVATSELLSQYKITTPEHLLSAPCACWRSDTPPVWQLGDEQIQLEPVLMTNDYLHLLRIALAGEAVVELPPFLAHHHLVEKKLTHVLPDFLMPEQQIRALVVEKRSLTPLIRQFLDFIVDLLPDALGC